MSLNRLKSFSKIENNGLSPFPQTLVNHNLSLTRDQTITLQINIGLHCNQVCRHCHLDAGPHRENDMMSRETMDRVIRFAAGNAFKVIDITGGAPELHPDLEYFIRKLKSYSNRLILRSNLTMLHEKGEALMDVLRETGTDIVASFPSLNDVQTAAIRGKGCFDISVLTLKKLNDFGYGKEDSGLCLDLVVNPSGAFLPPSQASQEKRFRKVLKQKCGIVFNNLYTFANVPLGRFLKWLEDSGNFEKYVEKLSSAFNPCTVDGLMCKTLISVSWDGYLYDCDFNQASGQFLGNRKLHISEINDPPEPGGHIATDYHCYTCTAGSGFT
ncbi:MAG TPA: radical SAM/Cys-rich domain protein [Deltaproteobacteria bacterium]|nr:radical SAM/Cys-rich domain protein [Deltaproteobacteria bacterium]